MRGLASKNLRVEGGLHRPLVIQRARTIERPFDQHPLADQRIRANHVKPEVVIEEDRDAYQRRPLAAAAEPWPSTLWNAG